MTESVRIRRIAMIVVIFALAATAAAWGLLRRPDAEAAIAPKGPPPVPVTSTLVQLQDVPVYRIGVGTVVAAQSVTVKPRVDGQLDKVEIGRAHV